MEYFYFTVNILSIVLIGYFFIKIFFDLHIGLVYLGVLKAMRVFKTYEKILYLILSILVYIFTFKKF